MQGWWRNFNASIRGIPAAALAAIAALLAALMTIPNIPGPVQGALIAVIVMLTLLTIIAAIQRERDENDRFGIIERRTALVNILSDNSRTRLISELWSMQAEIQALTSDYRLTRLLSEKYDQPAVMEKNGRQYNLDMLQTEAVYHFGNRHATRLLFLLEELGRHGIIADQRTTDSIFSVSDADGVDRIAEDLRLMMNRQAGHEA